MYNKDKQNKLYTYMLNRLSMKNYRRGWLKGNCPSCGKLSKYGINIGKARTNCFVCGYNPSPIQLVLDIERVDTFNEAWEILNSYGDGLTYEPYEETLERDFIIPELPEGYTNIALGDNSLGCKARYYMSNRGFDIGYLSSKGYGYCNKGKYLGYIIIPCFSNGRLIYFYARRFMGGGPRYNNPTTEDFGIGKAKIIYNIDALRIYKRVFLVEGAINADTIGDQAIATGGKFISSWQMNEILKSPVERIVIILDPDALKNAIDAALTLADYKKIKVVHWDGSDDINDIGRTETLKIVHSTRYMGYNDLLRLKHSLI
jgi:hypothetical protein